MAMSVFCDMFGLMFFGMTAATNTSNKFAVNLLIAPYY